MRQITTSVVTSPMAHTVYCGVSPFDGGDIRAAMTYGSSNRKTGNIDQLWVLADNGEKPLDAAKSGADASVCGDCPHRQGHGVLGDCYLNLGHAARSVWQSAKDQESDLQGHRPWSRGLRLGAYGDPAMLDKDTVEALVAGYDFHTGYTHQWKHDWAAWAKDTCMASADSPEEALQAQSEGWRTFRVTYNGDQLPSEVVCPATTHGVTCDTCRLCAGASKQAKSIVVLAHGSRSNKHLKAESLKV